MPRNKAAKPVTITCHQCGYDLRASLTPRNIYRCPECGTPIRLADLATRKAIREANRRQLVTLAGISLVGLAGVALARAFVPGPIMDLGVIHLGVGVFFFIIAGAYSFFWIGAQSRTRVIFAGGAGVLGALCTSLTISTPLSLLPLVLWWLAWHIWAVRGRYY